MQVKSIPGGVVHMVVKLNDESHKFKKDEIAKHYINCLREKLEVKDASLFAMAIMSNHVHLAIKVSDYPTDHADPVIIEMLNDGGFFKDKDRDIAAVMQIIHTNFSRRVHKDFGTKGRFIKERSFGKVVTNKLQLLVLMNYIHRNPYAAKQTKGKKYSYKYSTYDELMNNKSDLLDLDELYKFTGLEHGDLLDVLKSVDNLNISENKMEILLKQTNLTEDEKLTEAEIYKEISEIVNRILGRDVEKELRDKIKKSEKDLTVIRSLIPLELRGTKLPKCFVHLRVFYVLLLQKVGLNDAEISMILEIKPIRLEKMKNLKLGMKEFKRHMKSPVPYTNIW